MVSLSLRVQVLRCVSVSFLLAVACTKPSQPLPDRPRLTPSVVIQDVTFHSRALNRDMQHRVVLPRNLLAAVKLPAVYLLHGGGADFRSWTNDSDVANFAEQGFVLVMPEGKSSYYVNAEARPQDRYEDYIVKDLIIDAESRLPIASGRERLWVFPWVVSERSTYQ